MRISGFTIAKNTAKLYYPFKESILSILPFVDEYVIALGDCDEDDNTRQVIESIGDPKIKIIDSPWDTKNYLYNSVLAYQTDVAKSHCTGDWLFYLQTDEVVHENDLLHLKEVCKNNLSNKNIEGILFNYIHFWGDYNHHRLDHGWYKKEIRIIRNDPNIHSWRDAQGFRFIPNFDGVDYINKNGTRKLNVVESKARIFHYGWALPPKNSLLKRETHKSNIEGIVLEDSRLFINECKEVYRSLKNIAIYDNSHPMIMKDRILEFNWEEQLDYIDEFPVQQKIRKRMVTWMEQKIFHRPLFEFKNYVLLKNTKH